MGDSRGSLGQPTPFVFERAEVQVRAGDVRALISRLGPSARRDVVAWPVVLMPDLLAGRGTMPVDSVETYQRVEWTGPVPEGPFDAEIEPAWAVRRGDRTEYELVTRALIRGQIVASSRIVCRTKEALGVFGVAQVPAAPDPGDSHQIRQLTIGEHDVREFSEASRIRYAVTSTIGQAQTHGFRNVLVPGPLLALTHLAAWPAVPREGSIDVWFRGPVTAGSAMSLWRSAGHPELWSMRPIGGLRPATVARAADLDD